MTDDRDNPLLAANEAATESELPPLAFPGGDFFRENPLLEAVEALTKPERIQLKQDVVEKDAEGAVTAVVGKEDKRVVLPSLLAQLDAAIHSSMGGNSAGASLAFEGAPLNTAALFQAMKISSQVRDWCYAVKVIPVKNTAADLTAWFNVFSRSNPELEVERYRVKVLHGWASSIRGMLNPPREKDLPDACPVCSATEWWDMKTGAKYSRPLVIRYRPTDEDLVGDAKGFCRSCETVWGARELAYAIEEKAG